MYIICFLVVIWNTSYYIHSCLRTGSEHDYFMGKFTFLSYILFFFILLELACFSTAYSQTKVYGKIIDVETKETLPFVNVVFDKNDMGVASDIDGNYSISTSSHVDSIRAFFLGYDAKVVSVKPGTIQKIDFVLSPSKISLATVVISASAEDPAVLLFKRIVDNKYHNNREKFTAYEYEAYTKLEFDITNINDRIQKQKALKSVNFIFDHMDTTVNGEIYLPTFFSETLSDFYYRKNIKAQKEVIKASRISGTENKSISQFTGEMYQYTNIYDNYISIFYKPFVSPISDNGLRFYKYTITDTALINNNWCYKLEFAPKRKQELTFSGNLWVEQNTYAVTEINMDVAEDANLNYIKSFNIYEEFQHIDTNWVLTKDRLTIDFALTDNTIGCIGRKTSTYKNFILNKPRDDKFYINSNNLIVQDSANHKSEAYWENARHEKLTTSENAVYAMIDTLQKVPAVKTWTKIASLLSNGYQVLGPIEIGPYYTFYSFNAIEGNRFRFGGRTSNKFSTRLALSAYGAYGLLDQKMKYGGGIFYFITKKPRTSVLLDYKFDVEQLGESPNAFRHDDILSSIARRAPLSKLTSVEQYKAAFEREWLPGVSSRISFIHRNMFPIGEIKYNYDKPDGILSSLDHITTSEFNLFTRIAYGERFIDGEFERTSLGTKNPIFQISYSFGIKNLWNSDYQFHKVTLDINQWVNVGSIGWVKYIITAGKIFGTLPFPLLELHHGNETYAYDLFSYNLMNYYEFVSDEYVGLNLTHHFDGFFFNKVPFFRKLKWREIVSGNAVWGKVSQANQDVMIFPSTLHTFGNLPYAEAGVGIENIFKIIRVDALWRLTYLDHPDIAKWGIRVMLNFTF